jgi:eukaryotic-like serine/threonine-protein kinase
LTVPASSPAAAPRRETIGRYELLLELGRGGMAVLHLARAQGAGGFSKLFAIKQILPHLAADPLFVDMFLNEGRIAARLSHANLCPVFELGQDRGELFLVMEYLDGVPWETLARAMPRDARGFVLAAGVLAQACDGLHYAHTFRDADGTAMPIVHRDVSPQNLFVSADGGCRVLDFGVSKIANDHRHTRTGVLKGKLPYMAPEQLRGEPVDGRADVWAVGVMLWEALTGGRLFERDTDFLIYQAITDAAIPSVNAAAPRYPAAIDDVIARALARDRDRRHATARELGLDLARIAGELGGPASRAQIAETVGALCADPIGARKRAIAAALAARSAAPLAERADGAGAAHSTARRRADTDGDAAATVSMAMRRDSIIVQRAGRRTGEPSRWSSGRRGLAIAAVLVGGVAIVRATHGGAPDAPRAGPATARPQPVIAAPAAAPPGSSASTAPGGAGPRGPSAPASPAPSGTAAVRSGSSPAAAGGPGGATPARPPATRPAPGAPASRTHAMGAVIAPRTGGVALPARLREHDPAAGSERAPAPVAVPGWYAIDSTPYATIFIDDRKIGDTPLDRISLTAGPHRVRAVLADGRQRTFAIDIAPDRKTTAGTLAW